MSSRRPLYWECDNGIHIIQSNHPNVCPACNNRMEPVYSVGTRDVPEFEDSKTKNGGVVRVSRR